jgi:CubicO group peptidase (beta-lactamase class C family)
MKNLTITCLLILLQTSLWAQTKTQRLDSLFSALYTTGQFSGNVLIAENGKALYQKSFGMADIEKQTPIDPGTRFLLGSVSKQFTAAAIIMLKEAGKLSLDDQLSKYLPELPYPNITLRQVLNHTSGLPDYDALMNRLWDKNKFAINEDMLRMLIQYHPDVFFPPGQKYAYSNTGYALLALVIERVSKQSFTDYMEQHVFKAFGMNHTLIYTRRARPRKVYNYATGYIYQDSIKTFVLPEAHPVWKNALWEDGIYGEDGVNSTTGDLLLWDQAVFNRTVLQASDWNDILTPGTVKEGSSDYGFGWHILTGIAYHSGGWPGYMAYNEQHLDNNQSIIVLRNKFSTQLRLPVADIRAILSSTNKYAL